MERSEFCKGAKCAKLTIKVEGQQPLVFISKAPSLILEKTKEQETFTHDMTTPIERKFPFLIKEVEYVEGFWYYNTGDNLPKLKCPMPGTYPILKYDLSRPEVTDLYWQDDELFCYFDGISDFHRIDYYPNNQGSCTYKVFGENNYNFFDKQGILYKNSLKKELTYEIECDACCKDNEILCDSHYFPGYECYPIPPAAGRILKGKNDIARYWR